MHFNKFIRDSGGGVRGIILAKAERRDSAASIFRAKLAGG